MTRTMMVTPEARAVLDLDPSLRDLVDRSAVEYSEFFGGLPLDIHAYADEDSTKVKVYVAVLADPEHGSLMNRLHEFKRVWRPRHTPEEARSVGFSIHYV